LKIWEYSLEERLLNKTLTQKPGPARERAPQTPFPAAPRVPFRDGLEAQIAVAERSFNKHIKALRADNPDEPVSGDARSGILVFHGDRIVASLTSLGRSSAKVDFIMFVDEDRQGHGLAVDMWVAWNMAFCEYNVMPRNVETVAARKILIKAHRRIVELAVERRETVPQYVIDSVQPGSRDEREALRLKNGRIAA
jgi:hypothetical protein